MGRQAERNRTVTPTDSVRDRRIVSTRALTSPHRLRRDTPLTDASRDLVVQSRAAVARIIDGTDDRLLAIVGPCSVHDPVAGLDYARRLARVAAELAEDVLVVMRVYVEKPRTTLGWKGLVSDPGLDGGFRIDRGLSTARAFLVDVLDAGLPVGCEFLDPIMPQYLSDTVTWGAIGARTAQSPIHRQLASGLSMPVGIKNATTGDVQVAVDAIAAAATGQVFIGIDDAGRAAILSTTGNPDCHVVLRGGSSGPNYDAVRVADTLDLLSGAGLPRRVVVDASHGNSAKDHGRQLEVVADLAARTGGGEAGIVGIMVESFLVPGSQELTLGRRSELTYGQSVTDACIGWDDTVVALEQIAAAASRRRRLVAPTAPPAA
jgi:3-deoxy-7-phosphoheptulonate synthase